MPNKIVIFLAEFPRCLSEQTDSLFQQVNEVADEGKKFPILLFSNEDEGQSLNVLVSKYHYKGAAKITHGVSQKEQRKLRPKNWDCHYRNRMNTVISNVFKKLQNRMK